jgi:hypothetical protein
MIFFSAPNGDEQDDYILSTHDSRTWDNIDNRKMESFEFGSYVR